MGINLTPEALNDFLNEHLQLKEKLKAAQELTEKTLKENEDLQRQNKFLNRSLNDATDQIQALELAMKMANDLRK